MKIGCVLHIYGDVILDFQGEIFIKAKCFYQTLFIQGDGLLYSFICKHWLYMLMGVFAPSSSN